MKAFEGQVFMSQVPLCVPSICVCQQELYLASLFGVNHYYSMITILVCLDEEVSHAQFEQLQLHIFTAVYTSTVNKMPETTTLS